MIHISTGRFRRLAEDQDPQDSSDIAALKHDCWTYWGHSGTPLIARTSDSLIGFAFELAQRHWSEERHTVGDDQGISE